MDHVARCPHHPGRIALGTDHCIPSPQTERGPLRRWDVQLRSGRLVEAGVLHVPHHPNYRAPLALKSWLHPVSNRALTRPVRPGRGLIHDHGSRCALAVAIVKVPAFNQPDSHGFEISRSSVLPIVHVLNRTAVTLHPTFDLRVVGIDLPHGTQAAHPRRRFHPWQDRHALLDASPKLTHTRIVGINSLWQSDSHSQQAIRLYSRMDVLQLPEGPDHQPSAA